MKRLFPISLLTLLPQMASAHPGHDGDHDFEWGFSGGLVHPLSGLDHLLAMVAIGLWAAQLGGRARFGVPAAFVGAMAVGASLTRFGFSLPLVEPLVAASVLVLGFIIAAKLKINALGGAALAGGFALFHGAAHATEFAATGISIAAYAVGFLVATALLHLAGIGIGAALEKRQERRVSLVVGAAIAVSGAALLMG